MAQSLAVFIAMAIQGTMTSTRGESMTEMASSTGNMWGRRVCLLAFPAKGMRSQASWLDFEV